MKIQVSPLKIPVLFSRGKLVFSRGGCCTFLRENAKNTLRCNNAERHEDSWHGMLPLVIGKSLCENRTSAPQAARASCGRQVQAGVVNRQHCTVTPSVARSRQQGFYQRVRPVGMGGSMLAMAAISLFTSGRKCACGAQHHQTTFRQCPGKHTSSRQGHKRTSLEFHAVHHCWTELRQFCLPLPISGSPLNTSTMTQPKLQTSTARLIVDASHRSHNSGQRYGAVTAIAGGDVSTQAPRSSVSKVIPKSIK